MKIENHNAAVIGLGSISPVHIKALENIGIPITAVCDNKPALARDMGSKLNCAHFTGYADMLAQGGFDVLHICLPHHLHAPVAIAALKKGVHVVCEKPMATTVEDSEAMIVAAKEGNSRLEIIFQNRYNPASAAIKATLQEGKLGKVLGGWLQVTWHRDDAYYTESDWRGRWATEGGGVLINQSIHTFDLMNYFLGSPNLVSASVANRAHPVIEVEDVAEGVIFYGDVRVSFYVNTFHPYNAPASLEIVCEKGKILLRGSTASITHNDGRVAALAADNTKNDVAKDYWGYSHIRQLSAFYDSLKGKPAQTVSGSEGLITQRTINAIYDSSRLGKSVMI